MEIEFVKAVRDHAILNYEKEGWDYVVECYEDSEIVDAIRGASSAKQAIAMMRKIVKSMDSYRRDIQATAF